MFRFFRYRCIILRYILLWLFIITLIKLTTLFYYDLQQQSIDSSSLALPYDNSELNNEKLSNLTLNQTRTLHISSIINRTAIQYYRQYVERKNREQFMYNKNLFSSRTTRYILLVQVHTRVVYLKRFIEMLRSVSNNKPNITYI